MRELESVIDATCTAATTLQAGLVSVLQPVQPSPVADSPQDTIAAPVECDLVKSLRGYRYRVEELRTMLEDILVRLEA